MDEEPRDAVIERWRAVIEAREAARDHAGANRARIDMHRELAARGMAAPGDGDE